MPDNDRTKAWLEMLRRGDSIVFQIFTIAAAGVIVWEVVRRLPQPWRWYLQLAYLSASLGLFAYIFSGGVLAIGGAAAIIFVAAAGAAVPLAARLASAGWDWRHPLERRSR